MVIKGAQMSGTSSSHSHEIKTSETEEEIMKEMHRMIKGVCILSYI